jgi:hypothetical protein
MVDDTVDCRRLRAELNRRELTVKEFVPLVAAERGQTIHPSTIEKILVGDRQPSQKLYGAICRALGCNWDDLLLKNDEPVGQPS